MKRYPPKPLPYDADGDAIFDEAFSVASTTECTGLIPSAPASGAEADSYSDMPLSSASFWYGVNYSDSGEAEVTVLTITMYGQVADIMQYAAQNK